MGQLFWNVRDAAGNGPARGHRRTTCRADVPAPVSVAGASCRIHWRENSAPPLLPLSRMTRATARRRPPPVPTIEIGGLAILPKLRTRVVQRLRRALVGVRTSPIQVHVTFADVNGPKGGLDVRCAIDVRVPRTPPFHAEETATDDVTAFDRSAVAISRQIAEHLGRRQENGRRPKKYYAARRLL